jgi:hypothetical protein
MLIVATYFLMKTNSWAELEASLTDADALVSAVAGAAGFAIISGLVLLRLKRPPDSSGPD